MSQLSSLIDPFAMPGMFDPSLSTESEFTFGPPELQARIGIVIVSTAADAGNTPTSTLRRGLLMGQITSSKKYAQYNPAATDGTQIVAGVLLSPRNLYNSLTGVNGDRQGFLLTTGLVKTGSLILFDENARRQMTALGFQFDDYRAAPGMPLDIMAKTTSYTVLAADSNKHFTTTGAAGAVTFTLPATIVKNFRARFTNTVGQNMAITAPANKLITFNNATATTVTFSTAGNLIGASVEITTDETGAKYIVLPYGANTMTVS